MNIRPYGQVSRGLQMLSAGRCPQSAFGRLRRCRVSRKGSETPELTSPKPKKRGTERFRMHRAKLLSLRPVRPHRLAVSLVASYSAARPGVAVAVSNAVIPKDGTSQQSVPSRLWRSRYVATQWDAAAGALGAAAPDRGRAACRTQRNLARGRVPWANAIPQP